MTMPIVEGFSRPVITLADNGETVTITGDDLLNENDGDAIPEVTCCPDDGVTFAVIKDRMTDVSLEATIFVPPTTKNGKRLLKVTTKAGVGELADAFEVKGASPAKPVITRFSLRRVTPEDSGEIVTIKGEHLLAFDAMNQPELPTVTCDPDDGVTITVTPETLRISTGVALKAIIELDETTPNGWRKLKVETIKDVESKPKEKAFRVVGATKAADESQKAYKETETEAV
jgi:hypothetical protein